MWDRRAQYAGNYDGDTVTMFLDQGFRDTKEITVRLLGVFAPEMKDVGGPECKAFVANWFESRISSKTAWGFIVTTARMKVADREQMTLDRYVGTITTIDTMENLNLEIIQFITQNGYGGGTGSKTESEPRGIGGLGGPIMAQPKYPEDPNFPL